ncbi:ABC transporter substrate-binding protein [Tropicibacter sp. R16_0]|uniref:heme/hemin ABC transporter substrate-binding protein n=1 Tax=Tropicibacter sp. R16_0 TaxID=2821102 RepID=UPI001AD9AD2A|nr:ABC transporter substrate-binding protein [Tropicibacter sp. R16_0]MBO9452061.1 ABC transporter substrate-binding protein [Tropicibacter sp. R16_0]
MRKLLTTAAFVLAATTVAAEDQASRIISIGGAVTEIVYALGQEDRLVGRDRTSTYPVAANELPDIGYMRALAPEGVLSVSPDLIISVEGSGPPETIEVLRNADVEMVEIAEEYTRDGIVRKIRAVGAALDQEAAADELATQVGAEIDKAHAAAIDASISDPQRVLFILSTRGGKITASGTGTSADGIIRLAGGVNAVTEFESWKEMSPEAVSLAAPDVILMMARGGDHGAAIEELLSMPAIALTPAGQNRRIVRMDGLHMLGFGPRTASAITELSRALQQGTDS